jgi:hypothetical protein
MIVMAVWTGLEVADEVQVPVRKHRERCGSKNGVCRVHGWEQEGETNEECSKLIFPIVSRWSLSVPCNFDGFLFGQNHHCIMFQGMPWHAESATLQNPILPLFYGASPSVREFARMPDRLCCQVETPQNSIFAHLHAG